MNHSKSELTAPMAVISNVAFYCPSGRLQHIDDPDMLEQQQRAERKPFTGIRRPSRSLKNSMKFEPGTTLSHRSSPPSSRRRIKELRQSCKSSKSRATKEEPFVYLRNLCWKNDRISLALVESVKELAEKKLAFAQPQ